MEIDKAFGFHDRFRFKNVAFKKRLDKVRRVLEKNKRIIDKEGESSSDDSVVFIDDIGIQFMKQEKEDLKKTLQEKEKL